MTAIFAMHLLYLLNIVLARSILTPISTYYLNKSAQKKREKGQTIKEWFLYSRYREEIPRGWIIFYKFILIEYPVAIAVLWIALFIGVDETFGRLDRKSVV